MDENYAKAMQGIAMTRALIKNVYDTMRQGLESGDDPVIWMHNLAAEYGRQDAFKEGGTGAAMFTVAVYLLAESGYFEPKAIEAPCRCTKNADDGDFIDRVTGCTSDHGGSPDAGVPDDVA